MKNICKYCEYQNSCDYCDGFSKTSKNMICPYFKMEKNFLLKIQSYLQMIEEDKDTYQWQREDP